MNTQRVVLVTGGAKGVGAGISRKFLAAGDHVIVCGRSEPEQLPEAEGRSPEFMSLDVRDADAAAQLFTDIQAKHGRLDVLVNNAGGSPFVMADTASPRFHEAIIRLNLLAPLELARQANNIMQTQEQGGVVVFIGSVSAQRPSPGTAAYGAAKAGVLSLVQSLAVEWAPKVRVVAVSAGMVLTEQSELHYGDAAGVAAVGRTVPMGRLAQPSEIGDACVWMASTQAAYATGTHLTLHGGGERPAFLGQATANQDIT